MSLMVKAMMAFNPWLSLAGLLVGILVGMTGLGGGVLMTPLLIVVFGVSPSMAVGTDLVYSAVTRTAGAWQHWRQGTADMTLVKWLSVGSIPASIIGTLVVGLLRQMYGTDFERILGRVIGVTLLLVTLLLAYRFLSADALRRTWIADKRQDKWALVGIGIVGGFMVGLTSVGSGTVITVLLAFLVPVYTSALVGTSVAHAAILVSVSALAHLTLGDVDMGLAVQLLAGSIPGALIGSKLSLRMPQKALRLTIITLLFTSFIKLFA